MSIEIKVTIVSRDDTPLRKFSKYGDLVSKIKKACMNGSKGKVVKVQGAGKKDANRIRSYMQTKFKKEYGIQLETSIKRGTLFIGRKEK